MKNIKKYQLLEVSEYLKYQLINKFNLHYKRIIEEYDLKTSNKLLVKKIKDDIFGDDELIKTNIFIILAKSNCICRGNNSIKCFNIKCDNTTSLIELSKWNETKLMHYERAIKGIKSSIKKYSKEDNKTIINLYDNKNQEIKINFLDLTNKENIEIQKRKNLFDIYLFDHDKIKNIFDIIKYETLDELNLGKHVNKIFDKLIRTSLYNNLLLDSKLNVLYNLFKIGKNLNPDKNQESLFELTNKIEGYIDTTFGAGIYYLKNSNISGYASLEVMKEALNSIEKEKNKKDIKFTHDHIYRRKLASSFLRSNNYLDFEKFKELYKDRFSYVSFLTSNENNKIKDWIDDPSFMNIELKKFKRLYKQKLFEKNIHLVDTKVKTENGLKNFLYFLYFVEIKNKNIAIDDLNIMDVKLWFEKFQKNKKILKID